MSWCETLYRREIAKCSFFRQKMMVLVTSVKIDGLDDQCLEGVKVINTSNGTNIWD